MRAIKNIFVLAIILAVIGGGAVVALRVARGRPSAPETIKPNIVAVSAAGMSVYAARIGSKVVLFDTGGDPDGHPVDAALGALGAGRGDVTDIFITHAHSDHTAGAALFSQAKVHLGAADVPVASKKSDPPNLAPRIMAKVLSAPASCCLRATSAVFAPSGSASKNLGARSRRPCLNTMASPENSTPS